MRRRMCAENALQIRSLLDKSRAAGPQILADDYLSMVAGMVGFACVEQMISLDEHATYWVEINQIKDARAEARRALEKS